MLNTTVTLTGSAQIALARNPRGVTTAAAGHELPQVDEINPSAQFAATSRNQLLDLIRQNINHPSIFVWSLFNELRSTKPDPERPRSSSITVTEANPYVRAESASAYCRRWLSVCSATCPMVDWRI